MASANLLALIDDIATLLDDVSVMTQVAAKKTAGVLGDDLALNAQQVTGVQASREIPVVWAVAKGSLLNKAILVPLALVISAFVPKLIMPLLMIGGLFLCFEGVEKVLHKFLHTSHEDEAHHKELAKATQDEQIDIVAFEKEKIKGAVRTDFILSAEIIAITLGSIPEGEDLVTQALVLVAIALVMTVGVYGLVALIVKLDDAGVSLCKRPGEGAQALGKFILKFAPLLMKALSILGTLAMFLVGGGIVVHGLGEFIHVVHDIVIAVEKMPVGWLLSALLNGVVGFVAGLIVVGVVEGIKKMRGKKEVAPH